jgi:hypothetical protein
MKKYNWSIRDAALSSLSLFDFLLGSGGPNISQSVLNDNDTYFFSNQLWL